MKKHFYMQGKKEPVKKKIRKQGNHESRSPIAGQSYMMHELVRKGLHDAVEDILLNGDPDSNPDNINIMR